MNRVEQHIIHDDRFLESCQKAKNLYNQSLYYWRQSFFGKIQNFTGNELMKLYAQYDEENFRSLPSNTSQQIINYLFSNIRCWQKSKKQYFINPSKFKAIPKMPSYKKELSELYFTSTQIKPKNGFLNFPKMLQIPPIKTSIRNNDFRQCRVIPKSNHFVVELIYNVSDPQKTGYNGNWISIDIGLNNIATCSSNVIKPFIINGKPIKSVNNFYNKKRQSIQSTLLHNVFNSKRIERITLKRNLKIKDYLHKSSREIINKAKKHKITKIIIGKNENWKQAINLGNKTNREFTSIPHATLIEKIQYKALSVGIEVVLTQEAYTSKCSAFDLEPIQKHKKYLGKRKKRGLFVTSAGKLINADVNGSLNIARLVLGDEIINSDSIRSCGVQPYKIKSFI